MPEPAQPKRVAPTLPPLEDAPAPSSPAVRASMRSNRRRDTAPERRLRSHLHALGYRFRVDFAIDAPARRVRPDLVFTRARVAVFVDGCFWHCCPEHGRRPIEHRSYWDAKLARNRDRDRQVNLALRDSGWTVIRIWEHEDPTEAGSRVIEVVNERR
ncbi:MAG: very short patch repair endonuclease [Egibacteraceae bacterium]